MATTVGWISTNSVGRPRMVGLLYANSLGLHDMTGNVWEWVWDWFGTYNPQPSTDPVGAPSGDSRVLRGGSWNYTAAQARSVFRNNAFPGWRQNGFRVARP